MLAYTSETKCPEHDEHLLRGSKVDGREILTCPIDGCTALEWLVCPNCPDAWIHLQFRHEPGRKLEHRDIEWPDFFRCVRCGHEIDALYPHDYNQLKSPLGLRRAQEIWDLIPAHMKTVAASA